jgi:hypothetical protein
MEHCAMHNTKELQPIIEHAKLIAQKKSEIPHFIAISGCSAVGRVTLLMN